MVERKQEDLYQERLILHDSEANNQAVVITMRMAFTTDIHPTKLVLSKYHVRALLEKLEKAGAHG